MREGPLLKRPVVGRFLGCLEREMVIREQGMGKLSLIGVFTHFNASGFPFTSPPFYIPVFLTNFRGKLDAIDVTFRLEETKSAHVPGSTHGKINFNPDAPPLEEHVVIELPVQIPPTRFPEQGTYLVVVLVDGMEVKKRAINIQAVTSKQCRSSCMNNALKFTVDDHMAVTDSDVRCWIEIHPAYETSGRYAAYAFEIDTDVPESFWQGLRDCAEGRHIAMDRAFQEPPPAQ